MVKSSKGKKPAKIVTTKKPAAKAERTNAMVMKRPSAHVESPKTKFVIKRPSANAENARATKAKKFTANVAVDENFEGMHVEQNVEEMRAEGMNLEQNVEQNVEEVRAEGMNLEQNLEEVRVEEVGEACEVGEVYLREVKVGDKVRVLCDLSNHGHPMMGKQWYFGEVTRAYSDFAGAPMAAVSIPPNFKPEKFEVNVNLASTRVCSLVGCKFLPTEVWGIQVLTEETKNNWRLIRPDRNAAQPEGELAWAHFGIAFRGRPAHRPRLGPLEMAKWESMVRGYIVHNLERETYLCCPTATPPDPDMTESDDACFNLSIACLSSQHELVVNEQDQIINLKNRIYRELSVPWWQQRLSVGDHAIPARDEVITGRSLRSLGIRRGRTLSLVKANVLVGHFSGSVKNGRMIESVHAYFDTDPEGDVIIRQEMENGAKDSYARWRAVQVPLEEEHSNRLLFRLAMACARRSGISKYPQDSMDLMHVTCGEYGRIHIQMPYLDHITRGQAWDLRLRPTNGNEAH